MRRTVPLLAALIAALCGGCPVTAYGDRLVFEGTVSLTDNWGTCSNPVLVPGTSAPLALYWAAVQQSKWGPLYYSSVQWVERGERFHVNRDGIYPGRYWVTVTLKKNVPRARPSCVAADSIDTRP